MGPGKAARLWQLQPFWAQRWERHVRHERLLPRTISWLQVAHAPGPVLGHHAEGGEADGGAEGGGEVPEHGQAREFQPQVAGELGRPAVSHRRMSSSSKESFSRRKICRCKLLPRTYVSKVKTFSNHFRFINAWLGLAPSLEIDHVLCVIYLFLNRGFLSLRTRCSKF